MRKPLFWLQKTICPSVVPHCFITIPSLNWWIVMFHDFLLHLPKFLIKTRSFNFRSEVSQKGTWVLPFLFYKIKLKIGKKDLWIDDFCWNWKWKYFHFHFWCTVRTSLIWAAFLEISKHVCLCTCQTLLFVTHQSAIGISCHHQHYLTSLISHHCLVIVTMSLILSSIDKMGMGLTYIGISQCCCMEIERESTHRPHDHSLVALLAWNFH